MWSSEVIGLADRIEELIEEGDTNNALLLFKQLRIKTGIDKTSSFKEEKVEGPYFGNGPLPDEDW